VRKSFSLTAAGLAFFFLMSLFPSLVLLSSISSYLSLQNGVHDAMASLSDVLPEQSAYMIGDLARRIGPRSVGLWSIGFLITLWLASTALKGVILSLDIAYGAGKARPRWKVRSLALGLTILMGGLFLLAILLASFGPALERFTIGRFLKWSLATLFIFAALEALYVLAPAAPLSRRLTVPGALVATAIWVVISWTLGFYFRHYAAQHLGSLFGLLATPVAFMAWLYWIAAAILIGAEINSGLAEHHGSALGKAAF
jgi:membrane protein